MKFHPKYADDPFQCEKALRSGSLGRNTSKDVESSKFSFCCCLSPRGVTYGGKMIEFLCKVEPPARLPQVLRSSSEAKPGLAETPLGLAEREKPAPWEYFKYAGKGVVSLFGANSPSGGCLQTPQVRLESKSF